MNRSLPDFLSNRYVIGGPDEKNWTWIDHESSQSLDCVYSFQPYRVLRFDEQGECMDMVELPDKLAWPHGCYQRRHAQRPAALR